MIRTDADVAAFAERMLGAPIIPPYTCMGLEKGGELVAAVVFNHYERTDVHFTATGSGWTRKFMQEVGRYVFDTLGCERMTAITEQPMVLNLGKRIGCKVEGILRNHFGPGRDGVLIGVLRDEYKFRRS